MTPGQVDGHIEPEGEGQLAGPEVQRRRRRRPSGALAIQRAVKARVTPRGGGKETPLCGRQDEIRTGPSVAGRGRGGSHGRRYKNFLDCSGSRHRRSAQNHSEEQANLERERKAVVPVGAPSFFHSSTLPIYQSHFSKARGEKRKQKMFPRERFLAPGSASCSELYPGNFSSATGQHDRC